MPKENACRVGVRFICSAGGGRLPMASGDDRISRVVEGMELCSYFVKDSVCQFCKHSILFTGPNQDQILCVSSDAQEDAYQWRKETEEG